MRTFRAREFIKRAVCARALHANNGGVQPARTDRSLPTQDIFECSVATLGSRKPLRGRVCLIGLFPQNLVGHGMLFFLFHSKGASHADLQQATKILAVLPREMV